VSSARFKPMMVAIPPGATGGCSSTTLQAAVYLTWALAFTAYLGARTYGVELGEVVRTRGARGQSAAQAATHSTSSAARS
jgi:hypothetical protein